MLARERLNEVAVELASRPGHEKVRVLIYEILVNGLGARSTEVLFERPVPEVRGRIDALLGRTVFEFKTDMRRERKDAEEELTRYISDRERESGERFVGIATDGAVFAPYEVRRGELHPLPSYATSPRDAGALLEWISAAIALRDDLEPTPSVITRELGRDSLAWHVARQDLLALWESIKHHPDARLKRDLWARLLERVYGSSVDDDELFMQHTYLTVVAKTMATYVLGLDVGNPEALLSGKAFQEAGIGGVVESDFFDWPLASGEGVDLVGRIATQAARFRLRDVQADVLKGLYESLIDPEQRHDLGEYYTPDWLAQRICESAVDLPLQRRVLDPACGSGTFLFHCVRRFLDEAESSGLPLKKALSQLPSSVLGIDVHPVAVQIARVTYLLAIGEDRLRRRPANLAIPVYLGDSLQWNTRGFLADREILVEVPDGPILEFPVDVAANPGLFDVVITSMIEMSEADASEEAFARWLEREYTLDERTVRTVATTYGNLKAVHRSGRDHIWAFFTRNLVRPVWMSQESERADVVIGNPPWLTYNRMAPSIQERFKQECLRSGVWVGGRGITPHQDLSAYFFARCVELYLTPHGRIAFVMPYAALSRGQFLNFRTGVFGERRNGRLTHLVAAIHFTEAWALDDAVQPLFPVPSCVLFANLQPNPSAANLAADTVLPKTVRVARGTLPRRDATPSEAVAALEWSDGPWPVDRSAQTDPASEYGDAFRQGAIIIPRVLWVVRPVTASRLGGNPAAPLVESLRSSQEKAPWKRLPPVRGNVERQFLRPVCFGESVAPYRLLNRGLAVIPWDTGRGQLLDSTAAGRLGYRHLQRWLEETERLWQQNGRGKRSLFDQLDFYKQLSAQFPPAPVRVLFAASGTLAASAVLQDTIAVAEHKLYWMAAATEDEAHYLTSIFNSETTRLLVAHLQSRGQWGARDFDKIMFRLPIPRFDPRVEIHMRLVAAAREATGVAAGVELREGQGFIAARQSIRQALTDNGLAGRIDSLVGRLLGVAGPEGTQELRTPRSHAAPSAGRPVEHGNGRGR